VIGCGLGVNAGLRAWGQIFILTFQAGNPEGSLLLFTTDIAGNPPKATRGNNVNDKLHKIKLVSLHMLFSLLPHNNAACFFVLTSFREKPYSQY
jgi:hypothetical protein